jgi:hypothetical protein
MLVKYIFMKRINKIINNKYYCVCFLHKALLSYVLNEKKKKKNESQFIQNYN